MKYEIYPGTASGRVRVRVYNQALNRRGLMDNLRVLGLIEDETLAPADLIERYKIREITVTIEDCNSVLEAHSLIKQCVADYIEQFDSPEHFALDVLYGVQDEEG
tara:strand:+ start:162 stop:476 length:315 start_codon:yes stop_codon:yes gene_type:complete